MCSTHHFTYQHLLNFAKAVFEATGHSQSDAQTIAQNLLRADLRGVDSHGVARLSGYVRLIDAQRINPKPNITTVHQTPSTALLDADEAIGLLAGQHAMLLAIEKAKTAGTGWVGVRNSNHFGIAGQYAMMALEHDMIGWAFTNASPLVAPTFGRKRMLGTNPIAVAIPAHLQPPFVLDMATTPAANGKLEVLARAKQQAPEGWMQNPDGSPATDPNTIKNGGALLPLGSNRTLGSHKGYGLGALVDIISGVLTGANFGPWVPPFVSFIEPKPNPPGQGIGHFFGAMRIDAFTPASHFKQNMDLWINTFKNSEPANEQQPVLVPGQPERHAETQRLKNGINLQAQVHQSLLQLAERFDISL